MIARVFVYTSYRFDLKDDEAVSIYDDEEGGYSFRIYPPSSRHILSSFAPPIPVSELADKVTLKQDLTSLVLPSLDLIRIDFKRPSFDRQNEVFDPPPEVIFRIANSFLIRLRYVTRSAHIRLLTAQDFMWEVTYLNDDGSELNDELLYGRASGNKPISYTAINNDVWEAVHSLPLDFMPPPWDGLLLDARAALPEIGLAVTLAATALEVFVSFTLDRLAERSAIPSDLWEWINRREILKQPSLEEQFGELLRILSGKSLTENKDLWQKYKNLKSARNNYVHEGKAKVSKKSSPLQLVEAAKLVQSATDVISFVRSGLPDELKWPDFHIPNAEFSWTEEITED